MGRLTPQTMNNYRCKLRKLRAILPVLPDDHPEKMKVLNQIERLTNQLGMEMNDLEIALARGPGRPRQNPVVSEELEALAKAEREKKELESAKPESPEEREARVAAKLKAFREKVIGENPELAKRKEDEERSERELNEMIAKANEQLGGDNVTRSSDSSNQPGAPVVEREPGSSG